ncbi:MAG: DUF559 domain-containing protein [Acidimicrobiia bacterium]|nr:MAG: DUF559 domain-containing protein [Acidimicrobiia bacterium]
MDHRDRLFSKLASSQYGVLTLEQAMACGVSERTIESRVRRGALVRLHPGVYAVGGTPASWHRSVMAAVLSVNEGTAASHRTAAYLWGLTSKKPTRVEVVTTRHDRAHRVSFIVHESLDLLAHDIVAIDGIPVTTAARTVVDLGAVAHPRHVEDCLDVGLRKRLFTLDEVRHLFNRVARRGRRGVGVIRPMLEERTEWDGLTESGLEDLFVSIVRRSHLPLPRSQFTVRDTQGRFVCRVDFAYEAKRALIELDSEKHHMDPVTFLRDREKQNKAASLGWSVYRFTWRQLVDNPEQVLSVLAQITAD